MLKQFGFCACFTSSRMESDFDAVLHLGDLANSLGQVGLSDPLQAVMSMSFRKLRPKFEQVLHGDKDSNGPNSGRYREIFTRRHVEKMIQPALLVGKLKHAQFSPLQAGAASKQNKCEFLDDQRTAKRIQHIHAYF